MKRFVLSIDLGNDAMHTCRDVAGALRELASRLGQTGKAELVDVTHAISGAIYDDNGNRVGGWHVELAR